MKVKIGRWGKSLAFRIPADLAGTSGFAEGDMVTMDYSDGNLRLRRSNESRRLDAKVAAAELLVLAQNHTLDGIAIRELIDDGRR